MKQVPKWKKFEELAAEIQGQLSPGATVTVNDRILGKITGIERDVDISVRQAVGQYNVLIAIECKDFGRKADVKCVEEFIGLVSDIGANKAAIVSAKGFTETAKTRAKKAGIDLHRIIDTNDHPWKAYVTIPTLVENKELKSFSMEFSSTDQAEFPYQDYQFITLYTSEGIAIDCIYNLLAKCWNENLCNYDDGVHKAVKIYKDKTFMRVGDRHFCVDITVDIKIASTFHFGQLPIENMSGFSNELNGGVVTRGFKTAGISIDHIISNWRKIASKNELSVDPVLIIGMATHIPLIELK
jgi:hypothetical protein